MLDVDQINIIKHGCGFKHREPPVKKAKPRPPRKDNQAPNNQALILGLMPVGEWVTVKDVSAQCVLSDVTVRTHLAKLNKSRKVSFKQIIDGSRSHFEYKKL